MKADLHISVVRRTLQSLRFSDLDHHPLSEIGHFRGRFQGISMLIDNLALRPSHAIRDQGLADHRPIASFARLWCYRLIASDSLRRDQEEFFRKEAGHDRAFHPSVDQERAVGKRVDLSSKEQLWSQQHNRRPKGN